MRGLKGYQGILRYFQGLFDLGIVHVQRGKESNGVSCGRNDQQASLSQGCDQLGGVVQCLRKIQKKLSVISPARQPNAENAAKEAGVVSESKKEVSANVNAGRAGTEEINASIEELQRFLKALKTVC